MFFPSGSQIAAIIRAITSVVGAPGMKIEKEGKRENENERPSTQTPAAMTAPYLVFSVRSHDKRETQESSVTFRGPTLRIPHKKRVEWPAECARNRAAASTLFSLKEK